MTDGLNFSRRLRRTPYTGRAEAAGVRGFSVVNHMLLPKAYARSVEEDYWHLREHVQIWDVACQRQVQIEGPDATRLVQWMTPRDIGRAKVGDCLYVPITDESSGLINDPVLLKLAEDRFWLSIADSDLLLYAKGLAIGRGMNVRIEEPDVSPLAVQGPKAEAVMADLFGEHIREIGFFKFAWVEFKGTRQLIARSGYSRQGGFEIYLQGAHFGPALWDAIWEAGQLYDIAPGCPNLIERIEGGLLSYGNEMTRENNPLEIGLSKYCTLDESIEYIGRDALQRIAAQGITRKIRGVVFDGGRCPTCAEPWPLMSDGRQIGQITSAVWSPRRDANVSLAMVNHGFWDHGQMITVQVSDGSHRNGWIANLPM
ncbi:dimethylsulfoniopropionate demethylase [Defluviimonas aestuarii]|uniref:dimethylsulfoniopropionate demethylase n=1 Tax=Albidovulum aestuarii TaxID=1130726 RepID=UPI00249B54C5|nr:dimethylsulfoniopropionate demethylase [Defluviimonas aestuarii]MDI3338775.1 dimethylsulfoniopropionate demethylase [Defluviimonas aestuarii]